MSRGRPTATLTRVTAKPLSELVAADWAEALAPVEPAVTRLDRNPGPGHGPRYLASGRQVRTMP